MYNDNIQQWQNNTLLSQIQHKYLQTKQKQTNH